MKTPRPGLVGWEPRLVKKDGGSWSLVSRKFKEETRKLKICGITYAQIHLSEDTTVARFPGHLEIWEVSKNIWLTWQSYQQFDIGVSLYSLEKLIQDFEPTLLLENSATTWTWSLTSTVAKPSDQLAPSPIEWPSSAVAAGWSSTVPTEHSILSEDPCV